MARPTLYSEELADRICEQLIEGLSLVKICAKEEMPSRATVMRWMGTNEVFETKCARARELQADLMDDKILDTAEATTNENAQASKVKISAYQWRASKLKPKKYGDKVDVTSGGEKLPTPIFGGLSQKALDKNKETEGLE